MLLRLPNPIHTRLLQTPTMRRILTGRQNILDKLGAKLSHFEQLHTALIAQQEMEILETSLASMGLKNVCLKTIMIGAVMNTKEAVTLLLIPPMVRWTSMLAPSTNPGRLSHMLACVTEQLIFSVCPLLPPLPM